MELEMAVDEMRNQCSHRQAKSEALVSCSVRHRMEVHGWGHMLERLEDRGSLMATIDCSIVKEQGRPTASSRLQDSFTRIEDHTAIRHGCMIEFEVVSSCLAIGYGLYHWMRRTGMSAGAETNMKSMARTSHVNNCRHWSRVWMNSNRQR